MGVGGQRHAPAALPPGKTRYPLYSRLGGPHGRSGWVKKILPPVGFNPHIVLSTASRYTDLVILAHKSIYILTYIYVHINTYLNSNYSLGFSVQNSKWTNSSTHSGPLEQFVTMNCDEPPSPSNCHSLQFYTFSSQVQFICCSCCVQVFGCVLKVLAGERKDWYLWNRERLI